VTETPHCRPPPDQAVLTFRAAHVRAPGDPAETLARASLRVHGAITPPSIHSPADGSTVDTPHPSLVVNNATSAEGAPLTYEYELYLAVENIDHSRTKTKSPQTNGIVERFHKTMLDEFYRIAFRKRIYATIDELQADLDAWLAEYNEVRTHQGRYCYGKTPMQTFLDAAPAAREKQIGEQALATTSA